MDFWRGDWAERLTFAMGGMANRSEREGVVREISSCSCSENPSFWKAGRVYWVTSEFILGHNPAENIRVNSCERGAAPESKMKKPEASSAGSKPTG